MTHEERINFMQVDVMHDLIKRWNTTTEQFLKIDENHDILGYIRLCYEPFHLTGSEGIAEDIERYITERGGAR